MTKEITFLKSTIGLMWKGVLTRFEFYENKNGITIIPVSGNTLQPIKTLGTVDITKKEYNDIDIDPYDDSNEWEQTRIIYEKRTSIK